MHGARADCLVDNSDRAIGVRQVDGMTSAVDTYRAAVPAHLEMWNLADPGRLLHDLAAESPLLVGRSLLCQVARPATDQQLVAFTDAWPDGRPIDEMAAQDRLEDAMRRIGHREGEWDDDVRLTSVVVTVVVRDGRAVPRAADYDVVSVLRYANNRFQALRGELLIVTSHGWIVEPHGLAGLEPVAVLPSAGTATVSA
jgi:hypothetical protein